MNFGAPYRPRPWSRPASSGLLVSDAEREHTVELLRQHLLSGRLTVGEFEERVGEAWRARSAGDLWRALRQLPGPAPIVARVRSSATAVPALVLGVVALCLFVMSFGLLFFITLPISVTAWALGRDARREIASGRRSGPLGAARAGEVMGLIGTGLSALLMAGCAAIVF